MSARGGVAWVGDGVVGAEAEGHGSAACGREGKGGGVALDRHAEEVDLLEVGAIVAARLQAGQGELGGDVAGGEVASADAGAAAFEEIVGEELDVGADPFGVDGGFGGFDGGWDGGLGEERGGEEGGGEEEVKLVQRELLESVDLSVQFTRVHTPEAKAQCSLIRLRPKARLVRKNLSASLKGHSVGGGTNFGC